MAAIEELLDSLVKVLQAEVEIYGELLQVVQETQQALTNNNLAELNKALDRQQLLIVKSAKLEEVREQQLAKMADFFAVPPKELTLTQIINQEPVPAAYRQQLTQLQQELVGMVDRINATNRQNEVLIKDSLNYINQAMEIIAGAGDDAKLYADKPGTQPKKQQQSKIFDKRV